MRTIIPFIVMIGLLDFAACARNERLPALENRTTELESQVRSIRDELAKQRQSSSDLTARVDRLEQNPAVTTISGQTTEEPAADPADLAAANDYARASDLTSAMCRETSVLDKIAEARCLEQQVAGLEKLLRGRPLGVGVSAAAFGLVRVRCAKDFPRDFSMRAWCEHQELLKVAP